MAFLYEECVLSPTPLEVSDTPLVTLEDRERPRVESGSFSGTYPPTVSPTPLPAEPTVYW